MPLSLPPEGAHLGMFKSMRSSNHLTFRLTNHQYRLLREVLTKREPELLGILQDDCIVTVSKDGRAHIQNLLGDESCVTGLRPDSEPNRRGLQLEDLIDAFSPYK